MSEYVYHNYKFDAFMYSLQTNITDGLARDAGWILYRVAHSAEVTRDELLQLARRVYSGTRRVVTLMCCRTVQEVAMSTCMLRPARPAVQPGGHGGPHARAPSMLDHPIGLVWARAPPPPPLGQARGSVWAHGYASPLSSPLG